MPRFAANLSMMFTEHDFLDRFEAAARAGFQAVEYLFPYDHSPEVIREELDRNHLVQALFNMPAGDWAAGDRGLAALPERAEEFIASIDTAGRYAQILGCTKVHLMAGVCPDDPEHHRTYVDNVRRAADRLSPLGVTVLLEPLSPRATPGYFLGSVAQAVDLIAEIDHPGVGLQYDLFHAQQTDGDITHLTRTVAPLIGHVQIAAVPDRHEPDHGELDHGWILPVIDEYYHDWIGCEYLPAGVTEDGLGWLDAY